MKSTIEYQNEFGWFPDDDHDGTKSQARVRQYAEVLTPRWCVEMMLDNLEECSADAPIQVHDCESTVLEPCCGEGAFITSVLRRKLDHSSTLDQKIRSCQTCYGLDIQYDNVVICREKLVKIATQYGVDEHDARAIFARNIVHGDMLFFPMIIRFYDWKSGTWATLDEISRQDAS